MPARAASSRAPAAQDGTAADGVPHVDKETGHGLGIKAFSETDQTEDLQAITVPVLVTQGDDDQVVPYRDAAVKQAELLPNATLKIYEGYSHGMLTVNADVINPDLLAFIQQ